MPQLVKKRRSGWAVLAAGAMVASILAVGASPAAAQALPVDARTTAGALPDRSACLGPALVAADFEDVAMGGSHYSNINCIAHYGITTGREGGTQYAPHANVTRSQMALFLSRMAGVADVDLDDAMGAGFTDLDGIGADRVDAINRLVNAGIMTGSGNNTFSPLASVTRAEMALWLVNFMVGTTSSDDVLNVKRNPNDGRYSIEDTGTSETIGGGSYFGDSRATQPGHVDSAISAAFELGITTGYSDSTFKPSRTVSRQEMASFIVRTLAHTNARPVGLTAQRAGNDIQVSMRDAEFEPVVNEPVDVFGTAFVEDAFADRDGSCVMRYITRLDIGSTACVIDVLDLLTDGYGNAGFDASAPLDADPIEVVLCATGDASIVASPRAWLPDRRRGPAPASRRPDHLGVDRSERRRNRRRIRPLRSCQGGTVAPHAAPEA